jgi:hypothetical protein
MAAIFRDHEIPAAAAPVKTALSPAHPFGGRKVPGEMQSARDLHQALHGARNLCIIASLQFKLVCSAIFEHGHAFTRRLKHFVVII